MTIDSGVSNTAGYTFTGGDPTLTNIIGMSSITPYIGMGGGGKRRPLTKKIKRMSMGRIRSGKKLGKIQRIKKYIKKKKKSRINKKKNKRKTLRRGILKSIESGKPISKEDSKQLSPAMREFIKGMESDKSASVIKFSDFKSKPTKKKGRKKRTMTRASKNKRQLSKRGKSRMSGGAPLTSEQLIKRQQLKRAHETEPHAGRSAGMTQDEIDAMVLDHARQQVTILQQENDRLRGIKRTPQGVAGGGTT